MAKGRRLTATQSERLLGSSYSYSYSKGSVDADDSDLGEEDFWSTVDDSGDQDDGISNDFGSEWTPRAASDETRRPISLSNRHVGGLSVALDELTSSPMVVHKIRVYDNVASPRGHYMATSAPVNVPDWSKIYRVDSGGSFFDSDDNDNDDGSEMIPPHEYLACGRGTKERSVFEGVGRTLKGRDLRRVRDAVWSQTGFDG